jgi:tetratricopeptide (TPR) repeat protein
MSNDQLVTLEKDKRFSESCLWEMQREYFDKEGIDAWVNQVPFYVTSNPFIANCYTNLVIQFIRDWVVKHPGSEQHPFYIMELGTGSGRFSFYVMKKLEELRKTLPHPTHIRYIMSDFTKNNIRYWETHPELQKFLNDGTLDFAIYDLENDDPITLVKQNKVLTPESFVNPLTVFANYIFDTVSQDAFTVSHGNLQELLLTMTTDRSNMRGAKPIDWEQVNLDYSPYEVQSDRYDDEHFNAVLNEYKTGLTDSSFLFPLGGLRAMRKLFKLANNKVFLISSDKGYSSLESMEHLDHPRPSFHGSFSMMVNFHAIARYFKHRGGDYILQTPRSGIKTVVCCNGFDLAEMPNTSLAIERSVEGFSPADYFTLHRRISDTYPECDLNTIASHLVLTDWDPHIYNRISNRICAILPESDMTTVEFLAGNMHKLMANFYYMPKADNLAFEIGIFFHTIKNYAQALEYYQLAAPLAGKQFGLTYNIALCKYYVGEQEEALVGFKQALEYDPNSKEAKEWVEFIEKAG